MGAYQHRRGLRAVVGVIGGVVLLSGCGSDGGVAGDGAAATEDARAEWRQTDVCGLLTQQEVAEHLRGESPRAAPEQDPHDRPTCVWKAGQEYGDGNAEYSVRLVLWQPPAPEVFTDDPERVVDVGGNNGYVSIAIAEGSCTMNVQADPTWIQIETRSPSPEDPDAEVASECDRAGELVGAALSRLGW